MTPSEYADRYRSLTIRVGSEVKKNVRVEIYRLGEPDEEKDKLWGALMEHFRTNKRKNQSYSLSVRVDQGKQDFYALEALAKPIVMPFYGKGSPEDCQICLAVAVMMGRTSLANVQGYANKHIGLDCNGFVGNYIWREKLGNPWHKQPAKNAIPAPEANISSIYDWAQKLAVVKSAQVGEVADIDVNRSYILALVDSKFSVIPGPKPTGHIVITQPGRFMRQSFVTDTMGFYDLNLARQNAYGHLALWAVESTGPVMSVGLQESWYAIRPVVDAKKMLVPGVFNVFRGVKGNASYFRMVPVS